MHWSQEFRLWYCDSMALFEWSWSCVVVYLAATSLSWLLLPCHDLGCEYINTYNLAWSEFFNCNTNLQVGDISLVYYSTYMALNPHKKKTMKEFNRYFKLSWDICWQTILTSCFKRELLMNLKMNIHRVCVFYFLVWGWQHQDMSSVLQ